MIPRWLQVPGLSQQTVKEGVDYPQGLAIDTERSFIEEATPTAAVPITTFPLDQEMRRTRLAGTRIDQLVF